MATHPHPLTGVHLNIVSIERIALDWPAAVTAWVLRLSGLKYNLIAAMLGTNTHRIGEVFRAETWPGAEAEARRLMRAGPTRRIARAPEGLEPALPGF